MNPLSIEAIVGMVSDTHTSQSEPKMEQNEDDDEITPQQTLGAVVLLEKYISQNHDDFFVTQL